MQKAQLMSPLQRRIHRLRAPAIGALTQSATQAAYGGLATRPFNRSEKQYIPVMLNSYHGPTRLKFIKNPLASRHFNYD